MRMRLYLSLTSPYSRKVRVALEELGLVNSVEAVLTDPFNPTQPFLTANPLGKIPTLVTERGDALPDSRLILEYLVSRHSGLAPLPRGLRRWEILRRTELADGIIDAAVATVMERRRPEGIQYTSWLDRQSAAIHRALDALNTEAAFLAQDPPGICEISCGVALGYLDFRMPYLEWRHHRGALAQWYERFAQRPSMERTRPPAG